MIRQIRFLGKLILTISLSFIFVFLAVADTKTDTSVIGSWLGEIEMGGSVFRLVFNINLVDNGTLTGTVDSPDKGIKGIPLSDVKVTNDSMVFEVSAALASYNGKFSKDKNSISGIWKEGETFFSIILVRTTEIIEPKKPQL